jgi:hypothetical protein
MISICCTEPKPDYKKELTPEDYKKFCQLVNMLKKQGDRLEVAQEKAYSIVMVENIPC